MKHKHLKVSLTVLSLLAVSVLATPASALAHSGSHDATDKHGKPSNSTMSAITNDNEAEAADTEQTTGDTAGTAELRTRADKLVASERKDKKQASTVTGRQKACQARQTNLNRKITNYSKNANNHLEKYDATLAKLQAYQTDRQLTVPTYQTLVATATARQTEATTAVKTLSNVSVNIDCTSTDPAASVAAVKTSVKDTRLALQDYRTAVKNLLVALMTAKNTTDNTTDNTSDKPADMPSTSPETN